jgi:cell division protein FtsI/penicillin-binding protein 2
MSAVVLVAGVVGVGLFRPGVPSAEPTVSQFLLAWESHHYRQAAEMTTGDPTMVATELADAYERLDASDIYLSMRGVSQHGTTATASFYASIDLAGSGLTWAYNNKFTLVDSGGGWRVQWSPAVIVPGMTDGEQLAVVSSWDPRSQLEDSSGHPLTVPSTVYQVGVVPGQLSDPDRTAAALASITQLPEDQIAGQMNQGISDDFLPLLTLSPRQFSQLKDKIRHIPGIQIRQRTERLFDSIAPDVVGSVGTETASVLRINGEQYRPGTTVGLSGLQQTFQRQLTGEPRTDVILQQSGRPAVDLKTWPGSAGKPVRTTLNSTVQLAADQALDDLPASAAIVAVQANTGNILAVASHNESGMPSLSPLSGQYQPGQAFTIVSTAALLSSGRLSPSDPVPCPDENSVDGRNFRNEPAVSGLGSTPSFEADFAHACSTAFAGGLALTLTSADLTKASQEFGIGGWQLPVSAYFAGAIGQPVGEGRLAADMIGTGDVRVSPLGMALAASVVDSGRWHSPSLVDGMTDASSVPRATVSSTVLAQLRSLMRDAAGTREDEAADVGGDVYGQMGSAPFGSRHLHLNWFVGYQGNIAFAVVELGTSASSAATSLAGSFLQNIHSGS